MRSRQNEFTPVGGVLDTLGLWAQRAFDWLREYWRWSASRPLPVTLEGTVFGILAILIGLAAMNTGTNLLYLIFSLMVGFLLVSGVLSSRAIKRLHVQRSVPKHVIAGEPVDIRLTVRNNKRWFSAYGLQATDHMEDGAVAGLCYVLCVPPGGRATVTYPCVFHRRGLYTFSHVSVTTTYPFGFVRRMARLKAPREIVVYPQILPWERLGLETPPDFGERETHAKGPGASLYGIREQQPGEGARYIHWKKTAQLGRLMHREFEREEKKNVRLLFDNALMDPESPDSRRAFEFAVIQCASVAHYLLRADHQVELVSRSGRVPYNSGPHQRHQILRALALIEPVAVEGLRPLRVASGGDVATVVFRCDGQRAVGALAPGANVYVVVPPSHESLPADALSARPKVVAR